MTLPQGKRRKLRSKYRLLISSKSKPSFTVTHYIKYYFCLQGFLFYAVLYFLHNLISSSVELQTELIFTFIFFY
jgi:hypothetical protein